MKKLELLFVVVLGLSIFNNSVYAKWHPFSHAGEDATKPLAGAIDNFTDTFKEPANKSANAAETSGNASQTSAYASSPIPSSSSSPSPSISSLPFPIGLIVGLLNSIR